MIKINFSDPTQENPFGIITAEVSYPVFPLEFRWRFPLSFRVIGKVDNKIRWESSLNPGSWSSFVEPCNSRVEITDQSGNVISEWEWGTP